MNFLKSQSAIPKLCFLYLSLGTKRRELARKNGQYMIGFLSVMEYFLTPRRKKKKMCATRNAIIKRVKKLAKKIQESKECRSVCIIEK